MKKIFLYPLIFVLVCCVSVGTFNSVTGSNNRPYSIYECLCELSELDVDFFVSTDSFEKLADDFKKLNDNEYKLSDEYENASWWDKFTEDWYHNSLIVRYVTVLIDGTVILFSMFADYCRLIVKLLELGYGFICGVPIS